MPQPSFDKATVSENMALLRISEPKMRVGKTLHTEGLFDLFSSPNIIRVINIIRMRLTEHLA